MMQAMKDSFAQRNSFTERTDVSEMNLHEVELEQGDPANQPESIGQVGESGRFRYIKNRKYMRRLYMVLAALAAIFIFSSLLRLSIKKDNKNGSVKSSKADIDLSGTTEREGHLIILMHDTTTDNLEIEELGLASSPIRRALSWIANDDPASIPIPETRFDDDYPAFLQRYSAAVLAFAWGVETLEPLGFLSSAHECSWNRRFLREDGSVLQMGIVCDSNQTKVEKITIQTLGLTGTIPREIGNFQNLDRLHLDKNELVGSLPHRIERLQSLREFTATRNRLTGHLQPFIAKMKSLRHLELSMNLLEGHLGNAFGGEVISPIRVLGIDGNKMSGPVDAIKNMPLLEEIYLDHNSFTGVIGNGFRELSNLGILDMSQNKLEGKVPDYLLELPTMAILKLNNNRLNGQHPHGNSTKLKYLDISSNMIEKSLPRSIGDHPNLAYLDLSSNSITGTLPTEMSKLKQLQYLFLGDNSGLEPGPLPDFLSKLPVLRALSLKNTGRNGEIPDWVPSMQQLNLLDLESNGINGTIPEALGNMQELEYILLSRNSLTGEMPATLGNLTGLVLLNVDHNDMSGHVPDSVCERNVESLITDCATSDDMPDPKVECACCTKCCAPGSEDTCNVRDWRKKYEDEFEYYTKYLIVSDTASFKLIED